MPRSTRPERQRAEGPYRRIRKLHDQDPGPAAADNQETPGHLKPPTPATPTLRRGHARRISHYQEMQYTLFRMIRALVFVRCRCPPVSAGVRRCLTAAAAEQEGPVADNRHRGTQDAALSRTFTVWRLKLLTVMVSSKLPDGGGGRTHMPPSSVFLSIVGLWPLPCSSARWQPSSRQFEAEEAAAQTFWKALYTHVVDKGHVAAPTVQYTTTTAGISHRPQGPSHDPQQPPSISPPVHNEMIVPPTCPMKWETRGKYGH